MNAISQICVYCQKAITDRRLQASCSLTEDTCLCPGIRKQQLGGGVLAQPLFLGYQYLELADTDEGALETHGVVAGTAFELEVDDAAHRRPRT